MKVKISHTEIDSPNQCNYDRYAKFKAPGVGRSTLTLHALTKMLPVGSKALHSDSGPWPCIPRTLSGIHILFEALPVQRLLRLAGYKSSSFRDCFRLCALSCFPVFLFCYWSVCLSSCLFVGDVRRPDHQSGISHLEYISLAEETE